LTLGRIVLIPILVGSFYIPGSNGLWLGFAVFVLAAVTDFFDGWLARRLDQHSTLGRVLDPIADKLIVAAALVMLIAFDRASVIAVVAILSREFLIAGLREALAGTVTLPVHWLAKWKTAVQMTAIALLFIAPALSDAVPVLARVGDALLWLAVALTWVTAIGYLRAALRHILAPRSGSG
jgi:cardiolipin synthase